MARSIKVTVLVALPALAVALVAWGGMPDWLAVSLLALLGVVWFVVVLWPSHEAVLDRLIKGGQSAREKIIEDGLDEAAANDVYEAWYAPALERIEARFPAYADEFIVRDEPLPQNYSGQVAVIRRLVAKLGVLTEARRGQSG